MARLEAHIDYPLPLGVTAQADLCGIAGGDGCYLPNIVALLSDRPKTPILDTAAISKIVAAQVPNFDKAGDQCYNLNSLFIRRCAHLILMRGFIG